LRTRQLLIPLAVLFAGLLAVPAKLAAHDSIRVAIAADPTEALARHAPSPPAVAVAPPPVDHPIQVPDEPSAGSPNVDAPAVDDSAPLLPVPPPPIRPDVVHGAVTPTSAKVFGVVIGINDYPGTSSDLRGAVDDANDMSDALAKYGVPDSNVAELVDSTASAPDIVNALHWIVQSTAPDSTVVLFFAGHVRKVSSDTEAFVASDDALLPDWYLAQQLAPLPAHNVWIVMATCYGGGFTEMLAPGRVLTAASDANSLAYENDSFGRSYLDEYLVHQGLLENGALVPTAQAAYAYAQAGLQRDYPDRTLTEIDESTGPISIDGVPRDDNTAGPGPGAGSAPPPPSGGSVPPPTAPPSSPSPPAAPPPCKNVLGLFCPAGSR
jgi:hypothetical protein